MKNFRKTLAHLWADVQACFFFYWFMSKGSSYVSLKFGQNCCVFRYFLLNFKQPVLGYLKSYQAEMSTTYRWCQNLLVVKFSERYNVTLQSYVSWNFWLDTRLAPTCAGQLARANQKLLRKFSFCWKCNSTTFLRLNLPMPSM